MTLVCTTCDLRLQSIPDDAIQLTSEYHRVTTFRFADGAVHNIRKTKRAETIHKQWHKKSPKPDCEFCFPPPVPEPVPPQPPVEQVQVAVLEIPAEPEVIAEQKIEIEEPEPTTSMAAAFHRLFK